MVAMHTARDTDVLIVGSGASGLAAAITAAHAGLKVVVAEKANVVGGTSAFSGGWLWIPHAPHTKGQNTGDTAADVEAYLQAVLGERYDDTMMQQYLQRAPEMLAFFENHTAVKFLPGSAVPDFFGELAGAKAGWRSVVAAPYDGRGLGKNLAMLRRPIPETTLWGMGIASGADMKHFLHSFKSWSSFYYVGKRVSKHGRDVLLHGRSQQIVNGNALVARLLESALRLNVSFVLNARVSEIGDADEAGARSVVLDTPQGQTHIHARRAVVLAAGGFPHDVARQSQLFPHVKNGTPHHSAAPTTNTGDGLNLGERLGGEVDNSQAAAGAWSPVSLVPQADGTWGRFPHLVERGKPGLIAVRANGLRFTNEGGPYHAFVKEMLAATPEGERAVSWLICDHTCAVQHLRVDIGFQSRKRAQTAWHDFHRIKRRSDNGCHTGIGAHAGIACHALVQIAAATKHRVLALLGMAVVLAQRRFKTIHVYATSVGEFCQGIPAFQITIGQPRLE